MVMTVRVKGKIIQPDEGPSRNKGIMVAICVQEDSSPTAEIRKKRRERMRYLRAKKDEFQTQEDVTEIESA